MEKFVEASAPPDFPLTLHSPWRGRGKGVSLRWCLAPAVRDRPAGSTANQAQVRRMAHLNLLLIIDDKTAPSSFVFRRGRAEYRDLSYLKAVVNPFHSFG